MDARTTPEPAPGALREVRLDLVRGLPDARLVAEWDELAVAVGALPWARPGWLVPWWQHLGRGEPAVLTLRTGTELRGVMPLQLRHGTWRSPTDWHTPQYDLVAVDALSRATLLRRALHDSGGTLTLDFVPPAFADELARAVAPRPTARRVREASPYLLLDDGWEDRLDRSAMAEVRRRTRRAQEVGQVRLDVHDGSEGLDALLAEVFRVEAAGWRGAQGTAIASSPSTRAFYTAVGHWAAVHGLLRLAVLRLDDRGIAVDFAVEHEGAHYLLKTGYDESHRSLGPGKQLRLRMLQDCAARGLQSYEFLGDAQAWKREWTPLRRELLQVHAFAPSAGGVVGRVLHEALLPVARRGRDRLAAARS